MEMKISDSIYFVSYEGEGDILLQDINSKEFKFHVKNPQIGKKSLLNELEKIGDPTDELFIVCKIKSKRNIYQELIQTVFNISDFDVTNSKLKVVYFDTCFLLCGKITAILSEKLPSRSVLIPLKLLIKNLQLEICHPERYYEGHVIQKIKDHLHDVKINITSVCDVTMKFVVYDFMCTVKLTFPSRYPMEPVDIMLTEPFTYVFPKIHVDKQMGKSLKEDSMALTKDLFEKYAEMAMRLPNITGTAYLVLGAHPCEIRHGRTHYDNPSVFFLDKYDVSGCSLRDHDRFIYVDFSSPVEMGILAALLPNTFDEICFDKSTFKFFSYDDEYDIHSLLDDDKTLENLPKSMLYERLHCLTRMLKDTGTMFLEQVDGPSGGGWVGDEIKDSDYHSNINKEKVVDYCTAAGLDVGFKTVREIGSTSFLVPLLYSRLAGWEPPRSDPLKWELLVAHKTDTLR